MRIANRLTINADTKKVLEILRRNREEHQSMLKDARIGYLKEAKQAILRKLEQLKEDKIVELVFRLKPPEDYTLVYDTVIHALELHVDPNIELEGDQVRHLMMNEWDWMDSWLISNSGYARSIKEVATRKGLTLGR